MMKDYDDPINNKLPLAYGLEVPIDADYVLPPQVVYGVDGYSDFLTGIYFKTTNEDYGRITFDKLDAIKVCRGEIMPYLEAPNSKVTPSWVYRIAHSAWLFERYQYEQKHYGDDYDFGANVEEMLSDYNHYVFQFHDQFIEVIAKGFWCEASTEKLLGSPLCPGHPFLPLQETGMEKESFRVQELVCIAHENALPTDQLVIDAELCPQKLWQWYIIDAGVPHLYLSMYLMRRGEGLVSILQPLYGAPLWVQEGVATYEAAWPAVQKSLEVLAQRRKQV